MSDQWDNIPEELKQRDQWLLWDSGNDTPRRPHWRGNFRISWSDPDQWHSFDEAVKAARSTPSWGIGYVTAANNPDYARGLYGVIDIDGAADENDDPKDWVPSLQPFFDRDAYIEWSPSHNEPGDSGIHIPIVGMDSPDWWNDCQLDPESDAHEGVDVLEHKFCTFTGDTLRGSNTDEVAEYGEWVDDWLHEAYKVIKGDDPTADRDTELSDVEREHNTTDKEWLTEDVVEEALDHINPDVNYSTWKDIGMALANHFGSARGLSLFEDWSRGGTKWDKDAEKQAAKIARDASNYNYGAATIVHHAKQEGWSASDAARRELSKRSDGGTRTQDAGAAATAGGPQSPKSPSGPTNENEWHLEPGCVIRKAVLDFYHPLDYDEDGYLTGNIRDIRTPEKAHYVWQLLQETDNDDVFALYLGPIHTYDDGVWRQDDRQHLRETAEKSLGSAYSRGVLDELEERVRVDRLKHPDELGAPDGTIVTESGLLHLLSRETEPVRPDHYALAKIPSEHNDEAECPTWLNFLEESVPDEEQRKKLQEYAGYCLWHHQQQFGKAMFFVGPTDSGKGTALKAIKQVIGRENTASQSLRDLIQTRWGIAQLHGNIVNIRNEVSPSGLQNVQIFKELTGGEDEMTAEFKGQDKFDFVVKQKFMFSTNEIPTVQHADEAFYNRLLFVEFPNTVPKGEQDKQLLDKLKDERSGMLNWMLDGLERLIEQNQFTGERSINGKKEICDAFGGVIDRFVHNCLMVTGDSEDQVSKSDLHDLARKYADSIDKDPEWESQTGFSRKISKQVGIGQHQKRIDGKNTKTFTGVRIKPEVVYEFNMQGMAAVTGDDGGDEHNSGLNEYGENVRRGYDYRDPDRMDEPTDSAENDDAKPDTDKSKSDESTTDDDRESDELVGQPLAPVIVHYVREGCQGGEDVPREDLVAHLSDRGAADKQINYWINKCLERGDIIEPTENFYRR